VVYNTELVGVSVEVICAATPHTVDEVAPGKRLKCFGGKSQRFNECCVVTTVAAAVLISRRGTGTAPPLVNVANIGAPKTQELHRFRAQG
jgi:hypothetical protein